jgi:hypothetical protein
MLARVFTRLLKVTALGCSTAFLLTGQSPVNAEQALPRLSVQQTQQLSRDLVPYNSQRFFRQGQELIEREIQILKQRQISGNEPVLKINPLQPIKKQEIPNSNTNVLPSN